MTGQTTVVWPEVEYRHRPDWSGTALITDDGAYRYSLSRRKTKADERRAS